MPDPSRHEVPFTHQGRSLHQHGAAPPAHLFRGWPRRSTAISRSTHRPTRDRRVHRGPTQQSTMRDRARDSCTSPDAADRRLAPRTRLIGSRRCHAGVPSPKKRCVGPASRHWTPRAAKTGIGPRRMRCRSPGARHAQFAGRGLTSGSDDAATGGGPSPLRERLRLSQRSTSIWSAEMKMTTTHAAMAILPFHSSYGW